LGDDTIDGGDDDDTADFSDSLFGVTVTLGESGADGSATGAGSGTDILRGIENIIGTNVSDVITGNELNNTVYERGGNDTLNGGEGIDTLNYDGLSVGVTVDINLNTAQNTVGAGIDTIKDFERFIGTDFDDTFLVTTVTTETFIDGNEGFGIGDVDTLDFSNATGDLQVNTSYSILLGGVDFTIDDIEIIISGSGNDEINQLLDFEEVYGGSGDDTLEYFRMNTFEAHGGSGNDTLFINRSVDIVLNLDQNTIETYDLTFSGFENVTTGSGNDTITGSKWRQWS